jgi:hypothetical protein
MRSWITRPGLNAGAPRAARRQWKPRPDPGPQIDAPPPLKLWRTGDWRRGTQAQKNAKNTKGEGRRGVRRLTQIDGDERSREGTQRTQNGRWVEAAVKGALT